MPPVTDTGVDIVNSSNVDKFTAGKNPRAGRRLAPAVPRLFSAASAAMTVLLSVENISKIYPGVKALQEVSFNVEAGTVHAVMGENGAGKSTLMQVIAGAHLPTSGRLVFDGEEMHFSSTGMPPERAFRSSSRS